MRPRVEARLGAEIGEAGEALLTRAMAALKPRAKNLNELADGALFLFEKRPLNLDEKAATLLGGDAATLLTEAAGALGDVADWSVPALEEAVKRVAEKAELGLGKIAQPLRAALTGRSTSPGIFDVLMLLGRDESLARIADRAA